MEMPKRLEPNIQLRDKQTDNCMLQNTGLNFWNTKLMPAQPYITIRLYNRVLSPTLLPLIKFMGLSWKSHYNSVWGPVMKSSLIFHLCMIFTLLAFPTGLDPFQCLGDSICLNRLVLAWWVWCTLMWDHWIIKPQNHIRLGREHLIFNLHCLRIHCGRFG